MFTTIFNRSSSVFRRQAPADLQRGLRTTPVVRSSQGYGDPGKNDQPVSHEAADTPVSDTSRTWLGNRQHEIHSVQQGFQLLFLGIKLLVRIKRRRIKGQRLARRFAPKGKVSTRGTEHGAQGNGPDPQAADHMGSESGGGKPRSQQETKKVGEAPKSSSSGNERVDQAGVP
ncbi:hypothetical protein QFC20_006837 [Naganishia adeliensis]|uniref:Uncharacterized protein n=1 Tax=Naganishia adeliensis TaxID=92952 RepID=A0ACC2V6B5_9TREE|nr:hypothetical protein QFC20_006837 [Naganishia adeliensis]